MLDAIVIGAGPAGNIAARALAKKNLDVAVLEEHQSAGTPQHCTGLISDETIRMSGVKPDIINTLYGADVRFPGGGSVIVRSDSPKARLVDRIDLDLKMANAAEDAGALYSYLDKYESHTIGDYVKVKSQSGTYRSKVIVGADGWSSKVAMSLGENAPAEYVRGIQADVKFTMEEQDLFRVYLGNKVAPGFFAWMIPCGDFTRIGLCTSWSAGPPTQYLTDLLIKLGLQDKVIMVYAGKIPLGGRQITYGDRCLLAGDAAGFVKPISGGGLYPAFKANEHLVSTLTSCIESDSLYARELSEYERAWKNDIGKELDRAYTVRKKYVKLSDALLDKGLEYIRKRGLVPTLEKLDIDHPGDVIKEIISSPGNIVSALPLFLRSFR